MPNDIKGKTGLVPRRDCGDECSGHGNGIAEYEQSELVFNVWMHVCKHSVNI